MQLSCRLQMGDLRNASEGYKTRTEMKEMQDKITKRVEEQCI